MEGLDEAFPHLRDRLEFPLVPTDTAILKVIELRLNAPQNLAMLELQIRKPCVSAK